MSAQNSSSWPSGCSVGEIQVDAVKRRITHRVPALPTPPADCPAPAFQAEDGCV